MLHYTVWFLAGSPNCGPHLATPPVKPTGVQSGGIRFYALLGCQSKPRLALLVMACQAPTCLAFALWLRVCNLSRHTVVAQAYAVASTLAA